MTTFIGGATGTTSCTPPAHAVGDLILIAAFRSGSATAPTVPSGYTSLVSWSDSTNSGVIGYKIATSTSDASGTWTNATQVVCAIYRASPGNQAYPGYFATSSGSSTSVGFPQQTPFDATGTSWFAGFASIKSTSATLSTAPSGMTNREYVKGSAIEAAAHDTNGPVTNWPLTSASVGGSSAIWLSAVVEILDSPPTGTHGAFDVSSPSVYTSAPIADRISLSNGYLTATGLGANPDFYTIDSTDGHLESAGGQFYLEFAYTVAGSGNVGVEGTTSYFSYSPSNGNWYAWYGGAQVTGTIEGASQGDIIGILIDLNVNQFWVRVNGGNWNNSDAADPETGVGGIPFDADSNAWMALAQPTSSTTAFTINTGTSQFANAAPSGCSAWYMPPAVYPLFRRPRTFLRM